MPFDPESEAAKVGLPPRVFLYTLDQIAFLVNITEETLKRSYIHYEGRSTGAAGRDKLNARNIAPTGVKPDWRVSEATLIRWMKFKGYVLKDRGYVQ